MTKVIGLTGLSGVGKSTLLASLANEISFQHLQAGALVREGRRIQENRAIGHDTLRFANIEENQRLLVEGFALKVDRTAGLVVLDGHTIIEQSNALTKIESAVFEAIGIHKMIFLKDDPGAILARRKADVTRKRSLMDVEELADIQVQAQSQAEVICRELNVPLLVFLPSDIRDIQREFSSNVYYSSL